MYHLLQLFHNNSFMFVISCGFFQWNLIYAGNFYRLFVYLYCRWRSSDQGGYCWTSINRFNSTIFVCLSQTIVWISNIICHGLFCAQWVQLRWEVIVQMSNFSAISWREQIIFDDIKMMSSLYWTNTPS